MGQYSGFERKIARILESQPWLRDLVRHTYKRAIYFINRTNTKLILSDDVTLTDVAATCGVVDYDAFYFGYYDKSPWNNEQLYLAHILRKNRCYIAICDIAKKEHKILGESTAWNYQQGSMCQWLNNNTIIYNAYENDILGAIVYDINTNVQKFIPFPIQVSHPKLEEYLSLNYRRLSWLRPDYGYFNDCTNFQIKQDYANDGIWKVNYVTGASKLIIRISDLIERAPAQFKSAYHKVNHCYYSPDGKYFVFLHRWLDKTGKYSRLICSDSDGIKSEIILDFRMISHYSWINNQELIVWARTPEHGDSYIILDAFTAEYKKLDNGTLTKYGDGHPTFHLSNKLVLTDTYPNKSRLRSLLIFNKELKTLKELGKFYAPWKFDGEKRCDLHPRWNSSGDIISIDSAHEGKRKNYLIKSNF